MAITFGVATASGNTLGYGRSNNGALTITLPTGWSVGQLAILILYLDVGASTTPSDWTSTPGNPFGGGTQRLYIFTRVLQSGDSDPQVTISGSSTNQSTVGAIATYSGADIFEVVGSASSSGSGTTLTAGAVTTLSDGAFAVCCCGIGDNLSASNQTFGGSATGVTKRFDCGTASGNDSEVSLYDKAITTRASTGAGSCTIGASNPWISVILALRSSGVDIKVDPAAESLTLVETLTAPSLSGLAIDLPVFVETLTIAEETPTVAKITKNVINDQAYSAILDEAGAEIKDEEEYGFEITESLTLTDLEPVVSRTSFITGIVEPLTLGEAELLEISAVEVLVTDGLTITDLEPTVPAPLAEPEIDAGAESLTLSELPPTVAIGSVIISESESLAMGEVVTVERALDASYIVDESQDYIADESGDAIADEGISIGLPVSESLTFGESVTVSTLPNILVTEELTFFEVLSNPTITGSAPSIDILVTEHLRCDDGSSYDEYYTRGGDRRRTILTKSVPFESLTVQRALEGNIVIDEPLESLAFGESVEVEISEIQVSLTEGLTVGENLVFSISAIKIETIESLTIGESAELALGDIEIQILESLHLGEARMVNLDPELITKRRRSGLLGIYGG